MTPPRVMTSNKVSVMRNKQTLEEFIAYMKVQPRTYGYDAILAYDRLRANRLLLQEYIDRFDENMYFEPLTFTTVISPGQQWERLIGHVLDKPRLSFENASIASSRADLRMRITGGKQLTFSQAAGARVPKITRVKEADALDGPSLHVRLALESSPGSVSRAGTVFLDLEKADYFYLSLADTNEENLLGGERYKEIFKGWPAEKKKFVLNEMSVHEEDFLQPEKFAVRTHAAPQGTLSTSADFGDGEVLLFVTMRNSNNDNAGIPYDDASMNYMLPDAREPYTLNLVLGNKFLIERLVSRGFRRLPHQRVAFEMKLVGGEDNDTNVTGIEATAGLLAIPGIEGVTSNLRSITFPEGFPLPFIGRTGEENAVSFVCRVSDEKLHFSWSGAYPVQVDVTATDNSRFSGHLNSRWEWQADYQFSVETSGPDIGRLYLQRVGAVTERLKMAPSIELAAQMGGRPFVMEELVTFAERTLTDRLLSSVDTIVEVAEEIDAFRLNGLLFRSGKDAAQPSTVRFPSDLTLPGYLSPSRTEFQIEPMEPIVAAGRTQHFTLHGASIPTVTWSVESLPGEESEDAGHIDASGLYTAPPAEAITRGNKRVIVKAAGDTAFSKALVSITPRTIAASPYVFQAVGTEDLVKGFKVTGASDDGEPLRFELAPNAVGRLEVDPEPDPSAQQGMLYFPAKGGPSEVPRKSEQWLRHRQTAAWNPADDIYELLAIDIIEVSKVSGGAKELIPVVVPLISENRWFVHEAVGDSVRLIFMRQTKSGESEVPADQTTWYLVYGNGRLEDGVYTPEATDGKPLSKFAVILAIQDNDEEWQWTYAVVPLPLLSAQALVDEMQGDTSEQGRNE